jgi:hypothetical protein
MMLEQNTEGTTEAALADLRERLERLERLVLVPHQGDDLDRLAQMVSERAGRMDAETRQRIGQIEIYAHLRLPGQTHRIVDDFRFEDLLATSAEMLAYGISGLAHPARIAICKALLDGPKETSALLELAGLNTTGQLYHHLQAMAEIGLVERRGRNLWAIQNIGAFVMLLGAGKILANWRGDTDGVGETATAPASGPGGTSEEER